MQPMLTGTAHIAEGTRTKLVPRIIHQMFISPIDGSGAGLSADVLNQCKTWLTLHPDYEYRMWTLEEFLDLCAKEDRQDVASAVLMCRFPAMQVDIARLLILKTCGGFWADLKLYPRTSFLNSMRDHQLSLAEHFVNDGWHPGLPSSAYLGAVPSHAFFDTALSQALDAVKARAPQTFGVAGPAALERALATYFLPAHNLVTTNDFCLIPHDAAWGHLFDVGSGSYNREDNTLHWSQREQKESLYVDTKYKSSEYVTKEEVITSYRLLLGRIPGDSEIAMWASAKSIEVLRGEFFRSDEFRNSIKKFGFIRTF